MTLTAMKHNLISEQKNAIINSGSGVDITFFAAKKGKNDRTLLLLQEHSLNGNPATQPHVPILRDRHPLLPQLHPL